MPLDIEAIKRRIAQQHVIDFDDAEALLAEIEWGEAGEIGQFGT